MTAALLLATSILAADKPVQRLTGAVVHVADGDSVTILDAGRTQHKVRLLGIDAPELGKGKDRPGQPFAAKSKEHIAELVHGKPVRVEWRERDRYGRILGDVFVRTEAGQELWLNRDMVSAGLAWHYKAFDKRQELAAAESEAREAGRGIWTEKDPTPPWEWRRAVKRN